MLVTNKVECETLHNNNLVSTVPKKDIVILFPNLDLQSNRVAKRLKSLIMFVQKLSNPNATLTFKQACSSFRGLIPGSPRDAVEENVSKETIQNWKSVYTKDY